VRLTKTTANEDKVEDLINGCEPRIARRKSGHTLAGDGRTRSAGGRIGLFWPMKKNQGIKRGNERMYWEMKKGVGCVKHNDPPTDVTSPSGHEKP